MSPISNVARNPWYREPWPWLLMAGPAIVVVAGFVTLWLALSANDGLVVDDYYKQGKEVNRSLKRDEIARNLGLSALVRFDEKTDRVQVALRAGKPEILAKATSLRLTLAHATIAGRDQSIQLQRTATGYDGRVQALSPGKWHLLLEDTAHTWRLQDTVIVGNGVIEELSLRPPAE